ncbi:hypothetical protein EJ04DRAFT_595242 [Polyplosphaeria fusca]|uniref:Heterokaryon incompatibility domain-containing protein n=1 Tax=Polyplosphaeria fusca TaxID=682080 RepID=A0A9P4QJ25_9PLEO|nr:hypothetical protein EJ04DRAFT_595242 [Polyplosphaeria fusca]
MYPKRLADAMATTEIFSSELFSQTREEKLWPRRLLHRPTMTSVEREGEHTYLGIEKPKYNILSYTWGRYANTSGVSLDIKNVGWDIPSIKPERFTVDEFERVIDIVANGKDFIWLDIACIDQKNYALKMDEIGRQAGIFLNADEAFIWLHGSTTNQLQEQFDQFFRLTARLEGEAEEIVDVGEGTLVAINWEPDRSSEPDIDEGPFIPHCMKDHKWVNDMQMATAQILDDKWFSSLWTLQEASLRPEASFVSKNAELVQRKSFADAALINFVLGLGEIERCLTNALYSDRSELDETLQPVLPLLKSLESVIQRTGLSGWENPGTIYGSAAYRECVEPLDRIYGVMQIFGFRLGASADPTRSYSLDDLEHQFAVQINAVSPIMGQLFVHTKQQDLGNGWRVSQSAEQTPSLRSMSLMTQTLSTIQMNDTERPVFTGFACQFHRIAQMWKGAQTKNEGLNYWSVDGAIHLISLDENEYWMSRIPENLRHIQSERFEVNQALSELILEQCEEELEVLLLGKLVDPEYEDEGSPTTPGSVGILARRVIMNGSEVWQRLGICVWAVDSDREDEPGLWKHVSYVLG